eukprot:gene8122-8992_t
MSIKKLETKGDFDELMQTKDKLIVIDFFATWCGPCKIISPKFEGLTQKYPNVIFAKVDVDENGETSEFCQISAMPTFLFYKNGVKNYQLIPNHNL